MLSPISFPARRILRYWGLLGAIILLLIIVGTLLDTAPIWDSASYYKCIRDATEGRFRLHLFRCADHSSLAYILLVGLTQYADFGNVTLVYIANALLAAASAAGFYALLKLLLRDALTEYERGLLVTLSVLSPLYFTHVIHINLDFPLTCFFVLFLAFLLYRRIWMSVLAATAMVFTKETGMAVYVAVIGLYACVYSLPDRRRMGWKKTAVRDLPLLIPGLLIVLYFLLLWLKGWTLLWTLDAPDIYALGFNLAQKSIRIYVFDLFVLNYQWLLTLTIGIAVLLAFIRSVSKRQRKDREVDLDPWLLICLLLPPIVYLVTRYTIWNNPRYVLIGTPLLLLLFAASIASLSTRVIVRSIPLTVITVLIFLSNFRTIDPVSMATLGTFRFGTHRMLITTAFSSTSMYTGYGRDDIVYNLEFTRLQDLTADVYRAVKPTENTAFIVAKWSSALFPPEVDTRTFRPATDYRHSFAPKMVWRDEDYTLESMRGITQEPYFYFVAYPIFFNRPRLEKLKSRFPLVSTRTFERNGYRIDLYQFSLSRETPVQQHLLPST